MPAQAGIQGDSALASGFTAWIPGRALLARNDGLVVFVMPVKAGIQGDSALASDYTAWIPGLALRARNDASALYSGKTYSSKPLPPSPCLGFSRPSRQGSGNDDRFAPYCNVR